MGLEQIIISHSPAETEKAAEEFSRSLSGGEIIAFCGGLGMGKTCFVRGLARGLGFSGYVTSPTFALVNEYRGGRLDLIHFDMFRIKNEDDLFSTGYFDYMSDKSVLAVEWSENISSVFEEDTIYISLLKAENESDRKIIISRRDQI